MAMRRRKPDQPRNPRFCHVVLDNNALDRTDPERSQLVDSFLKFSKDMELSVIKPHGVEAEVNHPRTPAPVRKDMDGIYSLDVAKTPEEERRHADLKSLMRGNAKPGKHDADASHIFEASKLGGGYFVTHDERIHKRADDIRDIAPGIEIVSLEEFVAICRCFRAQA